MRPIIHRVTGIRLFFLPIRTRVPLKFGHETLTSVTCARACIRIVDSRGHEAIGWGETPLSVHWVWPSALPYSYRHDQLKDLCRDIARAWMRSSPVGHPLEAGYQFLEETLPAVLASRNQHGHAPEAGAAGVPVSATSESTPWLAALLCNASFDIALHDAYGQLVGLPTYQTYSAAFMKRDLTPLLEPALDSRVSFAGRYPSDFLFPHPRKQLPAWHLVGGLDPVDSTELTGDEPRDTYPILLKDWIRRDGLRCLKIKLRGNDAAWDYHRIVQIGKLGLPLGVDALGVDFNCGVVDPVYVDDILDRLKAEHRPIFDSVLYVEQPFPHDLTKHPIDVRSIAARKPIFLDESAHDWRMIRLGRQRGWNGVALKTCKTQTGAILSACWAKAHGMWLMVQDLTNPMLAQVPHALLAAHIDTIRGVETNAMQYYPEASLPEEAVHPGLYRRRNGVIDLSSIAGPGFGYCLQRIRRSLPAPDVSIDGF